MAKNEIDIRDEETRIVLDLEKALKDVIVKEGLVDTGRMRDSVKATLKPDNNGIDMSISIDVEDYFKYLDKPYKLTEQFENSKAFDTAIKKIEDGIAKDFENAIPSILNP